MEAIVLAGGLGTRLRDVVRDVPKPMALICGRPFLEHLLDYWIKQGIRSFILAVGYRHKMIQAHFGDRYGQAKIKYSVEKKPLGTGGGLFQAVRHYKTGRNLLVLNGDTFFEVSLRDLKKFHDLRKADLTLALASHHGEDRYERIQLDPDGRIAGLKQRGCGTRAGWINGGVYLFRTSLIKALIPPPLSPTCRQAGPPGLRGRNGGGYVSLENEILPRLIGSSKKVFGFHASGRFIDIGTPASYKAAGKFLKESE